MALAATGAARVVALAATGAAKPAVLLAGPQSADVELLGPQWERAAVALALAAGAPKAAVALA